MDTPEMKPVGAGQANGINGLKIVDEVGSGQGKKWVYFNNSLQKLLCRFEVSTSSLKPLGGVEVISNEVSADDFAINEKSGTVYLAVIENRVAKIELGSAVSSTGSLGKKVGVDNILGGVNETIVPGPTSKFLLRMALLYPLATRLLLYFG